MFYTNVQIAHNNNITITFTSVLTSAFEKKKHVVSDYLGSPRVVFEPSGTTTKVTQINAYYPFGMIIQALSYNAVGSTNRYHREGKEFISDFGHNRLDYLNRTYNPATGLFDQNDQLADKFPWISPKAFCGNNPLKFIDPDGRDVKLSITTNKAGKTVVTFNVTMSVSNKTSLGNETVNNHAMGVKSQIEKSFSGYDAKSNTEYKTVVTFDQNEKNFVLEFTSDVKGGNVFTAGKVDEIGNTNENKMQVRLGQQVDGTTTETKEETSRTGAHEYGHTLGLQHGGEEGSTLKSKTDPNLMNQSQNTNSTVINTQQLKQAQKEVEENQKK